MYYLELTRSEFPIGRGCLWTWSARPNTFLNSTQGVSIPLLEGSGFLKVTDAFFDYPEDKQYDPARCGAFADWLDDNKDRLLEPHADLRAEAEERLDSLIKWLRSGLQVQEV